MARRILRIVVDGNVRTVRIPVPGPPAGPVAPFDPTLIPWDTAYWAESAEFTALGLADGAGVATWPDFAGTRNAAGSATTSTHPLYRTAVTALNGKPAVEFIPGQNSALSFIGRNIAQPYTVVMIAAPKVIAGAIQTLAAQGGASSDRRAWLATRNGRIAATTVITGGRMIEDFEPFLFTGHFAGADSAIELQRTRIVGDAGTAGMTNLLLGSRNGGDVFDGHIAFWGLYAGDVRSHPAWDAFEQSAGEHYGMLLDVRPGAVGSFASPDRIVLGKGADGRASNPVVINNIGQVFHANTVREPGNALFDPVTSEWIVAYCGQQVGSGTVKTGVATSPDGLTWTEDPANPVGGATSLEDPYLCKNEDGTLHRDSEGRALLYCEEKPANDPNAQRGVLLYRSTANSLTGWTAFGRVLDSGGGTTAWDASDRTSPIVVFTGGQYVMLFEGRNLNLDGNGNIINEGEIGVAYSADGLAFAADPAPIILRSAMTGWYGRGIVTDDVIKVGPLWVMTNHGAKTGQFFTQLGRWSTADAPADWTAASWTEMAGNPYDTESNTAMFYGNDPTLMLRLTGPNVRYDLVNVYDGV